jgi:hypothetical protein
VKDQVGDPIAEPCSDRVGGFITTLVLDGVVQEGRNRRVFISAPLKYGGRDRRQIGDVGDVVALPPLISVKLLGECQRVRKPIGQHRLHLLQAALAATVVVAPSAACSCFLGMAPAISRQRPSETSSHV